MTTKPKARKFRIKRTAPALGSAAAASATRKQSVDDQPRAETPDTPTDQQAKPTQAAEQTADQTTDMAASSELASASEVQSEKTIDAIRQEGLTGRQLRMARR
ncbi:MAG: capsule biosynthesis protein, partial [Pseudomonadota bacterium]